MMWRWTVLALVAANGGFWLWSHGELRALGWGPVEVSEPGRLKTQIQPDLLRLTPQEPAAALAPGAAPDSAAAPPSAAPSVTPPTLAPVPSTTPASVSPPVSLPAQGK